MDVGLVVAALVALLLLILVAVFAGELAARLFVHASEVPPERRRHP